MTRNIGKAALGAAALGLGLMSACGDGMSVTDMGPDDMGQDMSTPPPPATIVDTNIAIVRLNADGTLDTSFGDGGIAIVDFGPGADTDAEPDGIANVRDSLWNVEVDGTGRLVLFGSAKGSGARIDGDRVVARVLADGSGLDDTFGTLVDAMDPLGPRTGMNVLNLANLGDNPRVGLVLADGKILASGYTSQPTGVGTQAANRPVLLRLNDDGTPDATFGANNSGVAQRNPFFPQPPADPFSAPWGMAEAYSAGVQGSGRIVTTGYGRAAALGQVNMVSLGFTANGQYDTTWSEGDADGYDGVFEFSGATDGQNDRGRNLHVLADDRVVIVGSGSPMGALAGDSDARVVVLTADGELDTSYDSDGFRLFDFGFSSEHFYGVARSPNGMLLAAAGYRSGTMGGVEQDDDATLAILPLPLGTGTEFTGAVPLSADGADRLFWVTFDASNRAVAAGFADLDDDGDTEMAVARFAATGALDTTFGTGGVVTINVFDAGPLGNEDVGDAETARGVIVLPDGKIVIAGPVEVVREVP